jgi:hypothetical protein
MIVGTVCYSTHSGLGHLARDFYRNGIVNRILHVFHRTHKSHTEWYPPHDLYTHDIREKFLDGLDVLLMFETAFYWDLMQKAKDRSIKTIIVPMYEYSPCPGPVVPDLFLCPSLLDQQVFKDYPNEYLPIPAPDWVKWRLRENALTFVHNAGHGQHGYAKGTIEVLEAARLTECQVKIHVRMQPDPRTDSIYRRYKHQKNIEWQVGADLPEEELFSTGDVYINAEQFNGLSMPLQEAYSAGMLVMTSDRFPANSWLPIPPLIPVNHYVKYKIPGGSNLPFDRAVISPVDIAKTIDYWYGKDIREFSLMGKRWAEENSWERLKPKYTNLLEGLCK